MSTEHGDARFSGGAEPAREEITLSPIGVVRSPRAEPIDDRWAAVRSTIEILPGVLPAPREAVRGLDAFSHIEVVYVLSRVDPAAIVTGARHPRGNTAWPRVGILAQRGKDRPNRLAVSRCRLRRVKLVERTGVALLHVEGLDAIDGTPVLDVKPWLRELGPRGEVVQPAWTSELMSRYWE